MSAAELLGRVAQAGFRVELSPDGPRLVRVSGTNAIPDPLLADLREHRSAVLRHLLVESLLARAREQRRVVWGLVPGEPRPVKLVGFSAVPAEWVWVCVEGDKEWTTLPHESA